MGQRAGRATGWAFLETEASFGCVCPIKIARTESAQAIHIGGDQESPDLSRFSCFSWRRRRWGEISIAVVNIQPSHGRSVLCCTLLISGCNAEPADFQEQRREYKLLIHFDTCSDKKDKLDRTVDRVKPWFMVHGLAHGS